MLGFYLDILKKSVREGEECVLRGFCGVSWLDWTTKPRGKRRKVNRGHSVIQMDQSTLYTQF